MFNKTLRIAGLARHSSKPDFYDCKRAQPSGQFYICSPTGSGYVNQRNPGKAKRGQSAKNDEADKQEMDNKNGVS